MEFRPQPETIWEATLVWLAPQPHAVLCGGNIEPHQCAVLVIIFIITCQRRLDTTHSLHVYFDSLCVRLGPESITVGMAVNQAKSQ